MTDPMNPDDEGYDPSQEGAEPGRALRPTNSFTEDAPYYEETAFAPKRSANALPWVLAGAAIVVAGGVGWYSHRLVGDAELRAERAEAVADQVNTKFKQLDADRKTALAQATDSTSKTDELSGQIASLTAQLKEKDQALSRLEDGQAQLTAKLKAAVKANPKGKLPKLVLAALAAMPKPSPPAGPAVGKTKRSKHSGHASRSTF